MKQETIKEKLVKLGVLKEYLDDYVDIFSNCSTPQEVRRTIGDKHWGAGYYQALLPHFRKLFQIDNNIRNIAFTKLKNCGISEEVIRKYITDMGDGPYLILRLSEEYQSIPKDSKEKLIENFEILMLKTLRRYLGYENQKCKGQ